MFSFSNVYSNYVKKNNYFIITLYHTYITLNTVVKKSTKTSNSCCSCDNTSICNNFHITYYDFSTVFHFTATSVLKILPLHVIKICQNEQIDKLMKCCRINTFYQYNKKLAYYNNHKQHQSILYFCSQKVEFTT